MSRLTIQTPNTLLLGIYFQADYAICMGNLRTVDGSMLEDVVDAGGPDVWELIAAALADCKLVRADNLIVFSNYQPLIDFGTPPIRIPQEDGQTEKIYSIADKRYDHIPSGGNPHQWSLARSICLYNRWHFQHTEQLPKAKERWQERHNR